MSHMRPGTKVKMWVHRFTNRPDVEPPGLLKFVAAISIFSVIGMLVYAVAHSVGDTASSQPIGISAAYVALLHFILPLVTFYTVSSNSPLSRLVITIYIVTLCSATIAGKGLLGELQVDETYRTSIAVAILVVVLGWLLGSPKMRYYYAAISNKEIPKDLAARDAELQGGSWLSFRARIAIDWFLDHMETLVLLGFIALAFYAVRQTGFG